MNGEGMPLAGRSSRPRPGRPPLRPGRTAPEEPRRDAATRLGDRLRSERERRGLALEQIAESTKIRRTYLEALERHDWSALPADVFTRGFVRAFAQHLGLDPELLLRVYARERRISVAEAPSASRDAGRDAAKAVLEKLAKSRGLEAPKRSGAWGRWLVTGLAALAIAAVGLTAFLWLSPRGSRPNSSPSPIAAGTIRVASVLDPAPPPKPEPLSPLAVTPVLTNAPEPPPAAEVPTGPRLSVAASGVGMGVADRELVGVGDRFEEGTVVWFWTNVLGGQPGDAIRHVWLHDGQTIGVAELEVNSPSWRTQSGRQLPRGLLGAWAVEARDLDGRVLARNDFTCVEASNALPER